MSNIFAHFVTADDEWHRYVFKDSDGNGAPRSIEVTTLAQDSSGLSSALSSTSGSSGAMSSGATSSTSTSASTNLRTGDGLSKKRKRAKQRSRSTTGDGDGPYSSSGSDSEETESVFANSDELDLTPEELAIRELQRESTPPPSRQPLQPRSPNCPSIQVVERFERNSRKLCRLPDGRVVTQYKHDQLVQVAKNNKLFDSLGLNGGASFMVGSQSSRSREDKENQTRGQLPASFVMPPPRTLPARAAKKPGIT